MHLIGKRLSDNAGEACISAAASQDKAYDGQEPSQEGLEAQESAAAFLAFLFPCN